MTMGAPPDLRDGARANDSRLTLRSALIPVPLSAAAALFAALFLLSMSLAWGFVHVDFGDAPLFRSLSGSIEDETYSAWRMHERWDVVMAVAAAVALIVNLRLALGRRDHAVVSAATTLLAASVCLLGVVWTMVDPPIPPIVDFVNSVPGLPDIELEPRFGLFVALALALVLVALALTEMLRAIRMAAAGRSV